MSDTADGPAEFVLFELAGWRYGIDALSVVELVRAVTIVPLPRAPAIVEGVIDLRGRLVPVLDIRARFNLPPRAASPSDHLIVAASGERLVALRVDRVFELARIATASIEAATAFIPGAGLIAGAAKLPDGLVLIHDIRTFLTRAEADALAALEPGEAVA